MGSMEAETAFDPFDALLSMNLGHVVFQVLSHLDFPSLRRCLWVCPRWRSLVLDNLSRLDFESKEEAHNVTVVTPRAVYLTEFDDGPAGQTASMFGFLGHEVVAEMDREEVLALDTAGLQRRMAPLYSHTFRGKFHYRGRQLYCQGGKFFVKEVSSGQHRLPEVLFPVRGSQIAIAGDLRGPRNRACALFLCVEVRKAELSWFDLDSRERVWRRDVPVDWWDFRQDRILSAHSTLFVESGYVGLVVQWRRNNHDDSGYKYWTYRALVYAFGIDAGDVLMADAVPEPRHCWSKHSVMPVARAGETVAVLSLPHGEEMTCTLFHAGRGGGRLREVRLGMEIDRKLRGVALRGGRGQGHLLVVCSDGTEVPHARSSSSSDGRTVRSCQFHVFDLSLPNSPLVKVFEPAGLSYFGHDKDGRMWILAGNRPGVDERKLFVVDFNKSLIGQFGHIKMPCTSKKEENDLT